MFFFIFQKVIKCSTSLLIHIILLNDKLDNFNNIILCVCLFLQNLF